MSEPEGLQSVVQASEGYARYCEGLRAKFPDGSEARYCRPGSVHDGHHVFVVGPGDWVKEGVNIRCQEGAELFVGYEDLRPLDGVECPCA